MTTGQPVTSTRPDGKLTVAELADLCGVRPITVYQWIYRGYIPRDGGVRRFLPCERVAGVILVDQIEGAKAEWHTRERARRVPVAAGA